MQHPRYSVIIPRRSAWQAVVSPAVAAAFSFGSLFNNSTGPYLLAVNAIVQDPTDTPDATTVVVKSGAVGSVVSNNPVPVVPDGSIPPGLGYNGSVAALPTATFYASQLFFVAYQIVGGALIVLPPQWSLTLYAETVNFPIHLSFNYQWLKPEELDACYGLLLEEDLGQ